MLYKLLAIAMMNADQKCASFSATPVFAELRQVTNELEEARQYSILEDGMQQDRCFLLSSYESVLLAHRNLHRRFISRCRHTVEFVQLFDVARDWH